MSVLKRINQIADIKGIKITALESKIGASKGVLSRAIKNDTDIQSKWISRIVENFPEINPTWLLTGEGEILKKEQSPADKSAHSLSADFKKLLVEEKINFLYERIENGVLGGGDHPPGKKKFSLQEIYFLSESIETKLKTLTEMIINIVTHPRVLEILNDRKK
ncbi:MAG: helix-turn-helix transcriptional regulator [Bergeyella sp.]|nr:helix-turn-helix transcriptional regulator [Bergeyella sp.]